MWGLGSTAILESVPDQGNTETIQFDYIWVSEWGHCPCTLTSLHTGFLCNTIQWHFKPCWVVPEHILAICLTALLCQLVLAEYMLIIIQCEYAIQCESKYNANVMVHQFNSNTMWWVFHTQVIQCKVHKFGCFWPTTLDGWRYL